MLQKIRHLQIQKRKQIQNLNKKDAFASFFIEIKYPPDVNQAGIPYKT